MKHFINLEFISKEKQNDGPSLNDDTDQRTDTNRFKSKHSGRGGCQKFNIT